jgi:hypothetical protein
MALANHVLLHGCDSPTLRVAVEAFSIPEDDEMHVTNQGFQIHDEAVPVWDKETMDLVHVYDVIIKG